MKQHLPAKDPVALAQMLKHILPNKLDKEYPPLTAFSALSCIKTVRYGNSIPADELDAAGRDFQTFRKSFSAYDVELIKVFAKGSQPSTHPQRAVFGLGHNYYIPPNATQSSISVGIQPAASGDRRASPLLLHLHRWPSTGILAMAYTLLPAKFLPNGENVIHAVQCK